MKGITVSQLLDWTKLLVASGYGDKVVLITTDDEGNGYHTLYYQFTVEEENIRECAEAGLFHDNNNPEDVVLLG